jgi:hypothetical protein
VDDDDFHAWREEEQGKREAASDLLAHIAARREANQARTEQLLETLSRGVDAELDDSDDDDLEEAA